VWVLIWACTYSAIITLGVCFFGSVWVSACCFRLCFNLCLWRVSSQCEGFVLRFVQDLFRVLVSMFRSG